METVKDLGHIYCFVKVGQFRSYSQAATALGVSRSFLSKSVKELEDKLGAALLKRNTRAVDFTEFGKHYYQSCVGHLDEIERISKHSKEQFKPTKDKVRVSLAGAYGEDVIAPMLASIATKNPGVEVDLVFSTDLVDIRSGEYDLAIRVSLSQPKKGHAFQISERREFVCASPNYLSRYGTPKTPKDLVHHNCLVGSQSGWYFDNGKKRQTVKVSGNFRSTNGRALLNAALAGSGLCKLPGEYVLEPIRNKDLVWVLSDDSVQPIPIWAVVPSKKKLSPTVKLLIQEFGVYVL